MTKLHLLPVLAALCFAALAGVALAGPKFVIEGRVYCDTCRAGFETSASEYIEGAKVRLECRHFETDAVNETAEGVTDGTGTYHVEIERSHDEEICEVILVKSSVPDCAEIPDGRDRARVLLTGRSGLASRIRYSNSLGFLKTTPLPLCGQLLQQYALGVDD
ncbi:hypothetical protein Cni_G02895 [Canna indica]|uniref:Uncharacterized protein n=1 Tax=Canna indica TaxID=4628 RepID=A0AAQ3Q0W8_9LILI|nr:hypothetical protein Cni_G02895 [Canna indica]